MTARPGRRVRAVTTAALAVGGLLLTSSLQGSPAAGTDSAKPFPVMPTSVVQPAAPLIQLTGYLIAVRSFFDTEPQSQTTGTAPCPSAKRTSGGGADPKPNSRFVSLNGSLPSADGSSWRTYVNNGTKQTGDTVVAAVCLASVPGYQVVTAQANNPPRTQTPVEASCPAGTVVYGGGGLSLSGSTNGNLNSSFPVGSTGWRADVNNNTATATTARAYAICGQRPAGYQILQGTPFDVGPSAQGADYLECPGERKPLSGGMFSNSTSVKVSINRILPSLNGAEKAWVSRGNNSSDSTTQFSTFVVCALATN